MLSASPSICIILKYSGHLKLATAISLSVSILNTTDGLLYLSVILPATIHTTHS
jgi:hypothetical protein